MRKIALAVTVAVMFTIAVSAVGLAASQVGVIELNTIIEESRAGKQANAVLNAFIDELRAEVAPVEAELEQMLEKLEDESLSDEARAALEAEAEELAGQYVAMVEAFDEEIELAIMQLREQVLSDIGVVLQLVGDSRGFDLIVDSEAVFYYRRVVDLTFEVIREYDNLWLEARGTDGGQ